jgi:hypothetical protein
MKRKAEGQDPDPQEGDGGEPELKKLSCKERRALARAHKQKPASLFNDPPKPAEKVGVQPKEGLKKRGSVGEGDGVDSKKKVKKEAKKAKNSKEKKAPPPQNSSSDEEEEDDDDDSESEEDGKEGSKTDNKEVGKDSAKEKKPEKPKKVKAALSLFFSYNNNNDIPSNAFLCFGMCSRALFFSSVICPSQ